MNVLDGATDLFVEYRGARPALELARGSVLGNLKQLDSTQVCSHRAAMPHYAIYSGLDQKLFVTRAGIYHCSMVKQGSVSVSVPAALHSRG